jgi:hypothetical protein
VRVLESDAYVESPATEFLEIVFDDRARVHLSGMHRIAGIPARDLAPGDVVAGRRVTRVRSYRGVERSHDLLTEDAGYRIGGIPIDSMIRELEAAGLTDAERLEVREGVRDRPGR